MSFTGQLGTNLSKPGSILLGSIGSSPLTVTVSDSLNNWSDSTARQLGYFIQNADTISLSDSARVVLGLHKSLDDNADNWNDAVVTQILGFLRVYVGDTLAFWDDFIFKQRINQATEQLVYKPSEVEYIRRYLNDVVIETLGTFTPSSNVVYKANEVTYIRRYLNDVV